MAKKKRGSTYTVEEGIIVSEPRNVVKIGGSRFISLPSIWFEINKYLGKEVKQLVPIADEVIILVPPEKKEEGKKILKLWKGLKNSEG